MSTALTLTPATELLVRDENSWAVGVRGFFKRLPAAIAEATTVEPLQEAIGVVRGVMKAAKELNRVEVVIEASGYIADAERRIVELSGPPMTREEAGAQKGVTPGVTPSKDRMQLSRMREAHPDAWETGEKKEAADAKYQQDKTDIMANGEPVTRQELAYRNRDLEAEKRELEKNREHSDLMRELMKTDGDYLHMVIVLCDERLGTILNIDPSEAVQRVSKRIFEQEAPRVLPRIDALTSFLTNLKEAINERSG